MDNIWNFLYPRVFSVVYKSSIISLTEFENDIFLTFDDGPDDESTTEILQILNEYKAKATFFCTGKNIIKHPYLLKLIIDQGHRIGNHGFEHLDGLKVSQNKFIENVLKGYDTTGSNLFRPPYGRMKIQQYLWAKENFKIILWNHMTFDFKNNENKSYENKIIKAGSIIVMHDSKKCKHLTTSFLRSILKYNCNKNFIPIPA